MINNAVELLDKVLSDLDRLDKGEIPLDKANAIFRGASVAINIQRTQMKYHEMRDEKPTIQFMENRGDPFSDRARAAREKARRDMEAAERALENGDDD